MSTDHFKIAIEEALHFRAFEDHEFAAAMSLPEKNIDDCIQYIFNQVKASGRQGFTDEEVFDIAYHYYTEKSIDIGSKINCKVVVNKTVELTPEEIAEAKAKALEELIAAEKNRLSKTKAPKPAELKEESEVKPAQQQLSLF